MSHLSESELVDLLEGRGSRADQAHVGECESCRQGLEEWRQLLEDLRAVGSSQLERDELHRLRSLFRARGPVTSGCREWIARLMPSAEGPALAVRGGGAAPVELSAGPFHVAVQVRAMTQASGYTVHGQVFADPDSMEPCDEMSDGEPDLQGEVIMSAEQGAAGAMCTGEIDDLGEFSVRVPGAGRYRATLHLPLSRIVIEGLEIE